MLGEARVVERGRTRMRHGPADDAEHARRGTDRAEAVEVAQLARGRLPGRRARTLGVRRECQEAAELRREHAAHQPELAHQQRDRRLRARREEIERLEVVADAARHPGELHDRDERIVLHRGDATEKIDRPPREVVRARDEFRRRGRIGIVPARRKRGGEERARQVRGERRVLDIDHARRIGGLRHAREEREPLRLGERRSAAFIGRAHRDDRRQRRLAHEPSDRVGRARAFARREAVAAPLDHARAEDARARGAFDRKRDLGGAFDGDRAADQRHWFIHAAAGQDPSRRSFPRGSPSASADARPRRESRGRRTQRTC